MPHRAKRFFDKGTSQAGAESKPLSESEERMLGLSESDAEFAVDPIRLQAFDGEISPRKYEAKIAALIRRQYRPDVESDADTTASYLAAYSRLREGDHYLAVILEQALGSELRLAASTRLPAILVKVGLSAGLTVSLVAGEARSGQALQPTPAGATISRRG